MALGAKIKQARLEAGFSQRQLCGDVITRNMLSQIENGVARPSMDTLQYLSGRLGKSVSFFLEEDVLLSPNPKVMEDARQAYMRKDHRAVLEILQAYQGPDALFDQEQMYLLALSSLALAEQLLLAGDAHGAAELLEKVHRGSIYYRQDQEQRRRLLLEKAYGQLEEYYRLREDYKQAYFYACKLRS